MRLLKIASFIFIVIASDYSFAGEYKSFKKDHKQLIKKTPIKDQSVLVEQKFKELAQKLESFFAQKNIKTAHEKAAFFQALSAMIRGLNWIVVFDNSHVDIKMPYERFSFAATFVDHASYVTAHSITHNIVHGDIYSYIVGVALKIKDKACKNFSVQDAIKLGYQYSLIMGLDFIINHAQEIMEKNYAVTSLAKIGNNPFVDPDTQKEFMKKYFGCLANNQPEFLILLNVLNR